MVLLWLLPPVVVTVAAMVWVTWLGRASRGEVDRDEALRRLGAALDGAPSRSRWRRARPPAPGYAVAPRAPERSTGVAMRRPAPPARPTLAQSTTPAPSEPTEPKPQAAPESRRRAS